MSKNDLVSVIVISYNAENTILETLESIKNQSYQNIELIVSDDCSKDKTVEICEKWIDENKVRFVNTKLLTVEQNTGVCANGNRGRFAATGKWLKGIAGDDILLPNCIEDFMKYINENPSAKFVTSFRRLYNETFDEYNFLSEDTGIGDNSIYQKEANEQIRTCCKKLLAQGPTMFYAKDVYIEVGGFNPKYIFEDYPFTLSVLEHGYQLHLLPKATVGYRLHNSLCRKQGHLFNYEYSMKTRQFFIERTFKYLSNKEIKEKKAIWEFQDFLHKHKLTNKNALTSFIYNKTIALIHYLYR